MDVSILRHYNKYYALDAPGTMQKMAELGLPKKCRLRYRHGAFIGAMLFWKRLMCNQRSLIILGNTVASTAGSDYVYIMKVSPQRMDEEKYLALKFGIAVLDYRGVPSNKMLELYDFIDSLPDGQGCLALVGQEDRMSELGVEYHNIPISGTIQ